MPYRVPTFNLTVGLWHADNPVSNSPNETFLGNLSPRHVSNFGAQYYSGVNYTTVEMYLLCPAFTPIRPSLLEDWGDAVEVPLGSGRYYLVSGVDDVAKGFPNEYRLACLYQAQSYVLSSTPNPWEIPPWPDPIP